MLQVRTITTVAEFEALGTVWNSLLAPRDPRAAFLRHEFVRAWYAAYGAGRSPHVLVAHHQGRVEGILPLVASTDRFAGLGIERLDLMANGHSPCADVVARAEAQDAVLDAVAQHLRQDAGWQVAVLPEIGAQSGLARLATRFEPRLRLVQPQRRAPYIAVAGDWEGFRRGLSKNFQRVLRNNRNRIARAGETAIERLEGVEEIDAALPDMFAIADRSWQGEAGSGVGSSAANRRFYGELALRLGEMGLVRLWFLRLAGARVAFEFHVVHAGVAFGLKTGYDRAFENVGAGTFLDQSIVERLFASGAVHEYDLLGDSDPYKLRWTASGRDYVRVTLFGSGAPARLLSLWNLRLKPALKRSRALVRRPAGTGPRTAAAAEEA
jgi:CelD/BcsL family acetyltransferase involved in cellulose biosynthesis